MSHRNSPDLDYFIQLHNHHARTPDHPAAKWDRRAEAWERECTETGREKNDDRVQSTVEFFRARGLLGPDCDVADIGCGPGRFAAAFAKTARSVTGFDLSERMIHYGVRHAHREGVNNVSFRVCDFQTLDLDTEGLAGRFDLVVSSITPATHGMTGLEKMMRMSRGFCCDITHLAGESQLESRIMAEVFHQRPPQRWSGHWFYSLFNVLFLMGFYPEVSYYQRRQVRGILPDPEHAALFTEHLLPVREQTEENRARILTWLQAQADDSGLVTEVSSTLYGRILWDVRLKTDRPDYGLEK